MINMLKQNLYIFNSMAIICADMYSEYFSTLLCDKNLSMTNIEVNLIFKILSRILLFLKLRSGYYIDI